MNKKIQIRKSWNLNVCWKVIKITNYSKLFTLYFLQSHLNILECSLKSRKLDPILPISQAFTHCILWTNISGGRYLYKNLTNFSLYLNFPLEGNLWIAGDWIGNCWGFGHSSIQSMVSWFPETENRLINLFKWEIFSLSIYKNSKSKWKKIIK